MAMPNFATSNSTVDAAKQISTTNKAQSGLALLIQAYCNSVNEQPAVDFTGITGLEQAQAAINAGLATAQAHANNYLNNIQPNIITNIANIGNYYALHNAVATTLPPGTSKADWIAALTALSTQSAAYQTAANGVVTSLNTLHANLTADTASFAGAVSNLNAAVNGDNGVLASDRAEVDALQSKIDGAIAGVALSGLAIAGGVFLVAVGGIADFVTAGTSTPLVVAGIAVVAAGIGGEVASALTLSNLNSQKATLLQQESTLTTEVALATGISSGYSSLGTQVKNAVDAATAMENAWNFLSSDLGSLITDLNNGTVDDGILQKVFLTAANTVIQTLIQDITTIKSQMTGITTITVAPGQTVGEAIVAAARKAA